MKMKYLFVLTVLVGMAGSSYAASVYPVQSGNWADPNTWGTYGVPPLTGTDEYKVFASASDLALNGMTITVNSNVGSYTVAKIDLARATTLEIQAGAVFGNDKELRVGDAGATGNGGAQSDDGYVNQTGGTLTIGGTGKLEIGYKTLTLGTTGTDGGIYTISGGTLQGSGSIYVAAAGGDGTLGKMIVDGSAGTISMTGSLYVANDSASSSGNIGNGTVEFKCDASGAVSKIQVLKTVVDSQDEEAAVAALVVDMTAGTATGDVVLIENTGADAVVGGFDTLNKAVATEGSVYEIGSGWFKLTYNYAAGADMVGNDIALVMVPEPATIAVLGLGGLLLRRRFA